jgi:hypothetical protein
LSEGALDPPNRRDRSETGGDILGVMRSAPVSICCSAALLLGAAGCSGTHHRALPSRSSGASASKSPRAVAAALAQEMLIEAALPADARPLDGPAPAALAGPPSYPGVGNLLFAHREVVSSQTPYDVWHFLQAHTPHGFLSRGRNSGKTRGQPTYGVQDDLAVLPLNISVAELWVSTSADASGRAVIRVEAEVAWTVPRPAEEYVRPGDRVMIASTDHPYGPNKRRGRRRVVTDPRIIRPLAHAFNALRLAPAPGGFGHECGLLTQRTVVYHLAFGSSTNARPRLTATLSCFAVAVTVNGHGEPTLDNLPDTAWQDLRRVLGIPEPTA